MPKGLNVVNTPAPQNGYGLHITLYTLEPDRACQEKEQSPELVKIHRAARTCRPAPRHRQSQGLWPRRGASVLVSSVKERVPGRCGALRRLHANALVGRSTYGRRGLGQEACCPSTPQSIYSNSPTSQRKYSHIRSNISWLRLLIFPLRQRDTLLSETPSATASSVLGMRRFSVASLLATSAGNFVLNVAIASDLPFLWIIARMFLNARYLHGLTENCKYATIMCSANK